MAVLKQRLHRKNSSGSYDTIHLETSASLVLMDDGVTTLSSKIFSMDTAINGKAPLYTYGVDDLIAGTSPLETGKVHFVYE